MLAAERGDPVAQLLAGQYPDPETGERLAAAARSVVIADSLDGREAELVAALDLGPRLAVVADDDTFAALGHRVERALAARFTVQRVVLGRAPHADTATIARLVAALDERTDAVVAVGSGTLNDLCKMAAVARGCPQVVFATAPSMNGYTSLSASITEGGLKRSVRAETPVGAFFDLGVLAAARDNARAAGVAERVSFVRGNVLYADLSKASVVTIYLLPGLINQLQRRFLDELEPGTRIVSHAFTMVGWQADRSETVRIEPQGETRQGGSSTIFLWVVPAKARGTWTGGDLRLKISQSFQEIDVEVTAAGKPLAEVRASLSGNDLAWEARGVRFRGRVAGDRIVGELSRDGSASSLELKKLP